MLLSLSCLILSLTDICCLCLNYGVEQFTRAVFHGQYNTTANTTELN
uniref:Uncharacterized protein n=1 Tax=Arundo donax TaxID=35708 RepID=A0A0A8YJR5_ARUDO